MKKMIPSVLSSMLVPAITSAVLLFSSSTRLSAQNVVNIQFVGDTYTSMTGIAGTGIYSSDYWNPVEATGTPELGDGGYPNDTFCTVDNLLDNNGIATGINIHMLYSTDGEVPTSSYSGSDPVPLINCFYTAGAGEDFSIKLDLPAGCTYDIYPYSSYPYGSGDHYGSTFTLDGNSSGAQSTDFGTYTTDDFVSGNQYVVFSGVGSGTHTITVHSGVQPLMNGLQIVIHHSLVNVQFVGSSYTSMTGAAGTGSSGDIWNPVQATGTPELGDGGYPNDVFCSVNGLLDNAGNTSGLNIHMLYSTAGEVPTTSYYGSDSVPLINSLYTAGAGEDFSVTLDLPPGNTYDIYAYSSYPYGSGNHYGSTFTLNSTSQSTDFGTYTTDDFVQGNQYVVFSGVSSGTQTLTVHSGVQPLMNGLQIVVH